VKAIRFEQVTFAYGDTPVLGDCSFEIPAGSLTTLVGASGAGKTTVVDLVIGLLQPTSGRIWIDDAPLDELDLIAWRRQIGYVPQENLLLHDTVLQNVTLGDPALGEADAEQALRAAGAWEFVARLPQGVHTPVGERGSMLSGGQRQRVMVARALVRRPRLLILDEATSALDPASAEQISATVRTLRGEITILAISHQVELVDVADRVYRFEGGRPTLVVGGARRPSLAQAASEPAAAGARG
jgi:ATP-binding cassette subfamily C protein